MTRRQAAIAGLLVVCVLLAAALTRQRPTLGGLPPAVLTQPPAATATPLATATPAGPARVRQGSAHAAASAALAQPIRLWHTADDVTLRVDGSPSVSPAFVDATLAREGSPLAGLGAYIWAQGRRWRVDPVFLLAFVSYFDVAHPLPARLHNVGHIRAGGAEPAVDGYREYGSWQQGIDAWYRLVHDLYVNRWHLQTLDQILPVYAPGAGRLDVEAEVNALRGMVDAWRGEAS